MQMEINLLEKRRQRKKRLTVHSFASFFLLIALALWTALVTHPTYRVIIGIAAMIAFVYSFVVISSVYSLRRSGRLLKEIQLSESDIQRFEQEMRSSNRRRYGRNIFITQNWIYDKDNESVFPIHMIEKAQEIYRYNDSGMDIYMLRLHLANGEYYNLSSDKQSIKIILSIFSNQYKHIKILPMNYNERTDIFIANENDRLE